MGQEQGSSLSAVKSIVRDEGLGGLFVGGKEQLMREIPFNALQFTMYEVNVLIPKYVFFAVTCVCACVLCAYFVWCCFRCRY